MTWLWVIIVLLAIALGTWLGYAVLRARHRARVEGARQALLDLDLFGLTGHKRSVAMSLADEHGLQWFALLTERNAKVQAARRQAALDLERRERLRQQAAEAEALDSIRRALEEDE